MYQDLKFRLSIARFAQLVFIYTVGVLIYNLSHIPHKWWVLLTIIIVGAAFEPGLMVQKAVNRGKGTIVGLTLCIPIIYLLQLNYRMVAVLVVLVSVMIWVVRFDRYEVTTTMITILVFLLFAYGFTKPTDEGPIEVVVNRLICTFFGISICLVGDYLLFRRFDYSRKFYFVLQRELIALIYRQERTILQAKRHLFRDGGLECESAQQAAVIAEPKQMRYTNAFLLTERMHNDYNKIFAELELSGASLLNSLFTDRATRKKVKQFNQVVWQLRKSIVCMYYAIYILKDIHVFHRHQHILHESLMQAKTKMVISR